MRKAAYRTRDALLSRRHHDLVVVDRSDPRASNAEAELLLHEPEALVPEDALSALSEGLRGTRAPCFGALVPEGVYPGSAPASSPYVAVWQFDELARARGPEWAGLEETTGGISPPAELRFRSEGPRRLVRGWYVHSFAGRRAHERPYVVSLVPGAARTVLDVGCGEGCIGAALVASGATVVGIEPDASAATIARGRLTRVLEMPLQEAVKKLSDVVFDAIVVADVLEHLEDPIGALRVLAKRLSLDGTLIFSVPNATHAAILAGALQGRWDPVLEGTVSDDHRVYAGREGWRRIFVAGGFEVRMWTPARFAPPSLEPWAALLTRSGLTEEELTAGQWVGVAHRSEAALPPLDLGSSPQAQDLSVVEEDDAVRTTKAKLQERGGRPLILELPNATHQQALRSLFAGDVATGDARHALCRAVTPHGLAARFRGTGVRTEVEVLSKDALVEPFSSLVLEARARGLPLRDGSLTARSLRVRFSTGP